MPAKYTNRRLRRHKKRQRKTQKRGGEEAKPAAPATTTPYILVQCSLDGNAKSIFDRNDELIKLDKQLTGKYLFKITDIKKSDEKQITPLKKRGFFKQYYELGDISNIEFKGKLVPSSYIRLKTSKSDIIIEPIDIEFKFNKYEYGNVFYIKTKPDPVVGDVAATNKYKLSNFKYIPRKWDVFEGDLNKKFIVKFPNVREKEEKPEITE